MIQNKKKINNRLIVAICLLLIITHFSECSSISRSSKVTRVVFFKNIPLVNKENNELSNLFDSVSIYNYNDYTLYEQPTIYNEFYNDELIKDNIYYQYFIFKKNDKAGYWYDSLSAKKITRSVKLDSYNDSLVSIITNSDSIVEEKYINKIKFDETYCDTTVFYYSKNYKNIGYSLSKELDSLKNSKVFKIRLIYNKYKSAAYGVIMPQREFLFEFKKAEVTNEKAIIDFVNRHVKNKLL
ncbi:MAG: hypothetical protein IPJ81_11305 [Chitinophagaceae bacterium]|nr:hypothetical protein [Chitinophagaceae bacterium]